MWSPTFWWCAYFSCLCPYRTPLIGALASSFSARCSSLSTAAIRSLRAAASARISPRGRAAVAPRREPSATNRCSTAARPSSLLCLELRGSRSREASRLRRASRDLRTDNPCVGGAAAASAPKPFLGGLPCRGLFRLLAALLVLLPPALVRPEIVVLVSEKETWCFAPGEEVVSISISSTDVSRRGLARTLL